jgi:predicted ribosome-associated RNA-binding protein Tma20
MTNKRNTDMAKAAMLGLFGLLVIIIIGIALAIYFGTKKSDDETSDKPEFTFDANAKKTINPEESSGSQEGYRIIEYAESDLDKSKLIDLTLSWTNGQGFDSVNKIILTRYVGGTKIQDNIEVTDEDMIKDYGTGSVTFKGSGVKANAKGKNVIKAYWNEVNESKILATAELDITEDDFSYTLTGPFGEYDVEVTIVGDTFKLEKSVKKIYYNLSFLPELWFKLQNNSDRTYSFKSIDNANKLKLDDQEKFKMKTYKGKKILIHPNDDKKILVVSLGDKKFKSESDMTRQDWGRASFTLTAATTITPGITDYEDIKKGYAASQSYKSPNGEYRLEFQDDGNLVVRKKDNTVMWESETHGNNKAKRIVVRPRYNNVTNGELLFSKTDDFAGGNIVASYGSISNNFTKPYTLILTDDGILTIIDKTGRHTEALDFIATKGNVKPGDAFYCGTTSARVYRYIGHNQKNHYANPYSADRMDGQRGSAVKINEKYCKNTRDGPSINNSVVDDFPQLVYDSSINLGVTNLCTSNSGHINTMKTKCKEHATCGGIGQQSNGCWHQFKGKGYRWNENDFTSNKYSKGRFNFGLGKTSDSYLFRM